MPVSKKRLALTNRGPSGLYRSLTDEEREFLEWKLRQEQEGQEDRVGSTGTNNGQPVTITGLTRKPFGLKDNIADPLLPLVVDIADLNLDPENARIHPMVNMQAIRDSLEIYGQVKPIVVRREGMIVVAGNGTLQAARDLGWTKIAANIIDMTYVEASGYGLADNRTAELAKWNMKRVAAVEKLNRENGIKTVGYSDDELLVIRAAQWIPPEPDDDMEFTVADGPVRLKFTPEQWKFIDPAIRSISPEIKREEIPKVISWICLDWLERRLQQLREIEDGEANEEIPF